MRRGALVAMLFAGALAGGLALRPSPVMASPAPDVPVVDGPGDGAMVGGVSGLREGPQQVGPGAAFVPWTGDALAERDAVITVQNASSESRRYLLVEFPAEEGSGCAACRVKYARCSGEIQPGATWSVTHELHTPFAPVAGRAATVIDLGPFDNGSQSIFCAEMSGHSPDQCERYRGLLSGIDVGTAGPVPVLTRLTRRARLGKAAEDLVDGLVPADVAPYAGQHAYVATGLYLDTLDGFDSTLAVQNAGTECVTATLSLHLTGDGPVGAPVTLQVPPGATRLFRPSLTWPYRDTGAVRLEAEGPLAVAVSTIGFDTAAAHDAEPRRPVEAWFAPLAFQEERRAIDPQDLPGAWAGGETLVATLNVMPDEVPISVRTQAVGKAARPIIIRLPGLDQTVFQFGFGLLLDGGPGWARMAAEPDAVSLSLEHVRTDTGGVRFSEQYGQRAWAHIAGEIVKTVALPDLGGPAVGAGVPLIAGTAMTDTLEARVAIQNLLSLPAIVSVEGSADCSATGAISRTVAGDSSLVLRAREVPGVLSGGNQAIVHVVEGEAAASVDIVRVERSEDGAEPPPDRTSGYRGIGLAQPIALRPVPRARLVASAAEIELQRTPEYTATLEVGLESDGPRCLGFTAATDAEWLRFAPQTGALPARLVITADALQLPEVGAEAAITVTANADDVTDSPLVVTVRMVDAPPTPRLFLPRLIQR